MISIDKTHELEGVIINAILSGVIPAFNPQSGVCVYDDGEGHRCAFSVLLPPDFDRAEAEEKNASTVLDYHPELFNSGVFWGIENTKRNRLFFDDIQRVHDSVVLEGIRAGISREKMAAQIKHAIKSFFQGYRSAVVAVQDPDGEV